MIMTTAQVIDLSHHDPASDYVAVFNSGIRGIIYKATQGIEYTDPTYTSQRIKAKQAGLQWGAYHFADSADVAAQAKNFLAYRPPDPDELFCLDWEDNAGNAMSKEQAQEWITTVETALGRLGECVIYSGNTAKERIIGKDTFFGSRRLWLAQYTKATPSWQESWNSYWLWQYSETGKCPGVNGKIDVNHYAGSLDQLAAEWASGSVSTPVA
jgi:lysozyme